MFHCLQYAQSFYPFTAALGLRGIQSTIKGNIKLHGVYAMNSFKKPCAANRQLRNNKPMTECMSACRVGSGYLTWSTGASGVHNEWPSGCISVSQAVIIMCVLSTAVIALIKDVG